MEQTLTRPPTEAESRVPARWVLPNLALRSLEATWDRNTWALLPDDGNRY